MSTIDCMVIRDKQRGLFLSAWCDLTDKWAACYEVVCLFKDGNSRELIVNEVDALKYAVTPAEAKKRGLR